MNQVTKIFYQMGKVLKQNSPTILTGLGIAGFGTSIIMAVKATPEAIFLIDIEEETYHKDESIKLSLTDKIRIAWKPYLPSGMLFIISSGLIISAQYISNKRIAVLASLYSIAETSLREYQEEIKTTIGTKKTALLDGEIAQKHLNEAPLNEETLIKTKFGEDLFYEELSGRYFLGNIEHIRKAENKFNQALISGEMQKTLNELYYEMGLEGTKIGDMIGWDVDKFLLEFKFSAKLVRDDRPCIVIDYQKYPLPIWFDN